MPSGLVSFPNFAVDFPSLTLTRSLQDGLRQLLNEDTALRQKLMPAMSDELLRRLTGEACEKS